MKHTGKFTKQLITAVFLAAFLIAGIGGCLGTGVQAVQAKKKTYTVTIVGNSLMGNGSQKKYFKQIAKLYGTNIKVYDQINNGYQLSDHVLDAKFNEYNIRKQLKKSDIVIFQEYGTRYETTYKDILKLQKYMKKSARSYYYQTEFDVPGGELIQKLTKHGVKIIRAEAAIRRLQDLGYMYEELHEPGDYHPNQYNGYTAAILMYTQIFGKKCTGYPVEKCPKKYRTFLRGKDWTEKKQALKTILKELETIRKG